MKQRDTPSQRLAESLEKNAKRVAAWTPTMRSAISTARVFDVGLKREPTLDDVLAGVERAHKRVKAWPAWMRVLAAIPCCGMATLADGSTRYANALTGVIG